MLKIAIFAPLYFDCKPLAEERHQCQRNRPTYDAEKYLLWATILSLTLTICLAIVASQICESEITRNSDKMGTYSSSWSSKVRFDAN